MNPATLHTYILVQSDTYVEYLSFFDESNNPIDLNQYVYIQMDIRNNISSNSSLLHTSTLSNDISIEGENNNILKIQITDTRAWQPQIYYRDIVFVDNQGVKQTFVCGKIEVINNVTNYESN